MSPFLTQHSEIKHAESLPHAGLSRFTRPLAAWQTRRPWLWAIVVGLGGLILTAFGSGFSQARHLDPLSATYAQAAFVALSAIAGLVIMWRTRPSLADYGFRFPLHVDLSLIHI